MRIEHVAVYVNDLEGARAFFEKYFGAHVTDKPYHNPRTDFYSYFMGFDDGSARLELMHKSEMDQLEKPLNRTGYAHLTFALGSYERVDELTARLAADGYETISGPRTTGDGYYEACVLGFEGNQIEITI